MTATANPPKQRISVLFAAVSLTCALLWCYWPTLTQMSRRWAEDPQYTHGYVVPIFAVLVLWARRSSFPTGKLECNWVGMILLILAGVQRLAGTAFAYEWLEAGSMIPAIAGIILLVGGARLLGWMWPTLLFLLFILPWPWQFDMLLTTPLRRVATVCSTYLLQTLGQPALARGNVIVINELEVGVVEACSGLGMLMTFFALSTAMAFVIDRPLFDRFAIFFSAIPVGVMMNVFRITITVFLYRVADEELAHLVFHDIAGWVMMPMALIVMWLELCWLGRLWLPNTEKRPIRIPVVPPKPLAPSENRLPVRLTFNRETKGEPVSDYDSRPEATAERSLLEIPDVAT